MALDKAIAHGKEKRKPYKGGKAVDYSCRNHGSCDYCKGNRLYNTQKKLEAAVDELQLNCNQIATKNGGAEDDM